MKRPFAKTIRGRFVLITMSIILILGLGISSGSYLLFYRDLRRTIVQSTETSLQLLSENVNSHLDNVISLLNWCLANDQLTRFLMANRDSANYNARTTLATDVLNTNVTTNPSKRYIQRLVIGSAQRSDFLQIVSTDYSVDKPIPQLIEELPYFAEHMETSKLEDLSFCLVDEPFTRRPGQIIPLIRPVQNPYANGTIGFVYLAISANQIAAELGNYTLDTHSELMLCINDTYYICDNDMLVPLEKEPEFTEYPEHYQIRPDTKVYSMTSRAADSLAVCRPLSLNGCSLIQTVPPETLNQQFHHYFLLIFLIFILIMVIGLIMIAILSQTFTKPVEKLRKRLSLIANGNFSEDTSILWNNELGDMGQDINRLSADIQALIARRLEDENEKRDYEYRLLQSQVNPHFLYNTLNSIKWMATIQNAPGIVEMTVALSGLLKNISKGSSTIVTIRHEFELLDNYFTIQKYRYGGTISMEYDVEDASLLDNEIPRFSLQPIVENAIFHGIEPKGQAGIISIRLFAPDAQTVRIDITDNGLGIEEEKIRILLTEDVPDHGAFFKNVGVSNVHKRLQYTYGDAYGLRIVSVPGSYTTVSTLLPRIRAKEEKEL